MNLNEHRELWADVAKENGWYKEPFFIQVWCDPDNNITDSVSFRGLNQDIIEKEDEEFHNLLGDIIVDIIETTLEETPDLLKFKEKNED